MGLKNELLDLKEKLQIAVNDEDADAVEEIVGRWWEEGWSWGEIAAKFQEWTGMPIDQFDNDWSEKHWEAPAETEE